MDPSHLDELVRLEDTYWWHVAKRQMVVDLLRQHCPPPGRLVEGGIGSGRNLLEFQRLGYAVTGFDLMPESVAHVRGRGINDVRVHNLEQPWPVEDGSIDAVVLLDVLEHVADPVAVLDNIRIALSEHGFVFITVPAHPWLFSRWDEQLGHFRRYTTRELRRHASEAGFRVELMQYWNSFTMPAAVAIRGWEKLFPKRETPDFPEVSDITNRALMRVAGAERWCLNRIGVPMGLSLVGVLKK